jgi:hypothetical protein
LATGILLPVEAEDGLAGGVFAFVGEVPLITELGC